MHFNMGNYTLYQHINKANGKVYVGITSQAPERRWAKGEGYKQQRRFYSAIKHYGWDGFLHVIIKTKLEKAEAEEAEARLVRLLGANDPKRGYNIENGGVVHKLTEEQKEHLRQVNYGKKHTEETKRKMSEVHKGDSPRWLTGRKASEATKAKMSAKRKGVQNHRARTVYQYKLNGDFVAKYDCMEDAKRALGISSTSHISRCCNGTRNKAHGFMWSYELTEKGPYQRLWKGGIVHG